MTGVVFYRDIDTCLALFANACVEVHAGAWDLQTIRRRPDAGGRIYYQVAGFVQRDRPYRLTLDFSVSVGESLREAHAENVLWEALADG
jgi:hypothetical protein